MPSKKKKYNARFPAGRIKKIMQTDEEVGKVAQAVPVIISRTLELFVESLLKKSMQITLSRNAKTLTPSHMKQCILSENRFDFLKDLVKDIPDASIQEDNENNAMFEESLDQGEGDSDVPAPVPSHSKRKHEKWPKESLSHKNDLTGPSQPKKQKLPATETSTSSPSSTKHFRPSKFHLLRSATITEPETETITTPNSTPTFGTSNFNLLRPPIPSERDSESSTSNSSSSTPTFGPSKSHPVRPSGTDTNTESPEEISTSSLGGTPSSPSVFGPSKFPLLNPPSIMPPSAANYYKEHVERNSTWTPVIQYGPTIAHQNNKHLRNFVNKSFSVNALVNPGDVISEEPNLRITIASEHVAPPPLAVASSSSSSGNLTPRLAPSENVPPLVPLRMTASVAQVSAQKYAHVPGDLNIDEDYDN